MKKMRFASIATLCMVPAMFWSNESSAIPSWARKYNVSCYMCHSGFANRNATGEAFMNNAFHLPGGGDEAFTKQENIKLSVDDWKKSADAPNSGSIPQFDPLAVAISGNVLQYSHPVHTPAGVTSGKILTINAPSTLSLFYGATLGKSFTVFGQLSGLGTAVAEVDSDATTVSQIETNLTHSVKMVYEITEGLEVALGNSFAHGAYNGYVSQVNNVLPAPQTYAELTYTAGETGGYTLTVGTSTGVKYNSIDYVAGSARINDLTYVRGKIKLIGAGLLSGTGGEFGDNYLGVDNQLSIGGGLTKANKAAIPNGFTSTSYLGETLVYGGDIQAAYHNVVFGFAASKDKDLKLSNYQTALGWYALPYLYAKVTYADIANASAVATPGLVHTPTITPSLAWWVAPNISLTGTYVYSQRQFLPSRLPATATSRANTFNLALSAAF
ncbi:MAG: hypothetical protein WCH05_05650 [Chlorobiaceae bacterium]